MKKISHLFILVLLVYILFGIQLKAQISSRYNDVIKGGGNFYRKFMVL